MPKKTFDQSSKLFKVTFLLPPEVQAETVCLCGDFNDWNKSAHPMKKQKDGSFKLTLQLEPGRQYHFRYLLDGERWENDWEADTYVPNQFGSEDSVLILEEASD